MTGSGYCSEHMFAFSPPRPRLSDDLVATLRPVTLAKSRIVPVCEPWTSLMSGGGLRRGSTVVVHAQPGLGGLSVASEPAQRGQRQGSLGGRGGGGRPRGGGDVGLGVDLRRVLFVPRPRGAWAEAAADLLDGVDLLIVRPPSRASHGAARKLMDRVRERGTVLIVLTEPSGALAAAGGSLLSSHQFALDHVVTTRRALRDVARRGSR